MEKQPEYAYPLTQDRLLTMAEYERLPEEDLFVDELVRGMVVREPRPGGVHGVLVAEILGRMRTFVNQHGLGRAVTETGFAIATDPDVVRGPDVAFVSRDRIPADGVPTSFWAFAPDLAVEV